MDTRTPEQHRRIMRSVGSKHTGPEMAVRRLVHGLGYRYRLHLPDLVLARHKVAIFVHGCLWHGHRCSKGRLPKTRSLPLSGSLKEKDRPSRGGLLPSTSGKVRPPRLALSHRRSGFLLKPLLVPREIRLPRSQP